MADIKTQILRAIFQGATLSVAASTLIACGDGTDDTNTNANNGWNVLNNQNNKADMGSDMSGDMKTDMNADMSHDMKHDMATCDETLPRLPDNIDVSSSPGTGRYIVCADISDVAAAGLQCAGINEDNANTFINLSTTTDGCAFVSKGNDGAKLCGPIAVSRDQCCYAMEVNQDICAVGRPFIVDGMVRTAQSAQREGWLAPTHEVQWPGLDTLPKHIRMEIAAAWANTGCHEHASIASFSAFMMDLMQLGAPKDLVEMTTKAINDEIDHAARCFSIASAYAGVPIGPEQMDTQQSGRKSIEDILIAAIDEGCIGETCAAAQAQLESSRVRHPYLRETLEVISEDETDHALLAWRFVDWILDAHPNLVPVAKQAFEQHPLHKPNKWARGMTEAHLLMQEHGYTPAPTVEEIRRRAYQNIVTPCAQALIEKHTRPSNDLTMSR